MARSFNGTSDRITPGAGVMELTSNWTVGARFILSSTAAAARPIWSRWTSISGNRQLMVYRNQNGATIQVDIPFIAAIVTSNATINDTTTWHSVVATRAGNLWSLYIDGLLDNTATNATVQETGAVLDLFNSPPGGGTWFAGSGADVFGANSVWQLPEARAFHFGARPTDIRPETLIGYWPLDGYGHPALDQSIWGHNGVLTGTAFASDPIFVGPQKFRFSKYNRRSPFWPGFDALGWTVPAAPVPPLILMPQIIT